MFNEELLGLFESELGGMAQLTKLSGDLRNKIIAIYGDNGSGKTTQIARLGKLGYNVVFISLEKGLNAVNGVMNIGVKEYADVKKAVEKLTATKKGKPNKFLEMLEKVKIRIEKELQNSIKDFKILGLQSFSESCIKYRITYNAKKDQRYSAKRTINMIIKEEYDNSKISIPYNILEVRNGK